MSGIFLILWEDSKERTLPTLDGGYPHVTLTYTGKTVTLPSLKAWAAVIASSNLMGHEVTLERTTQNNFLHEKSGKQRYDVFLIPDSTTMALLQQAARSIGVRPRDFHVTVATLWSQEDANREEDVWISRGPLKCRIVGVTLD